jgi:sialate O-acetylesterase
MNIFRTIILITLTLFASSIYAALELPLLFSDGMVLQRDQAIHVWGWSKPGDSIRVSLAKHTAQTTVAKDGGWQLDLPKLKAGGPFQLTIQGAEEEVLINDVLIGDVWICSGQSNMEFTVKDAMNAAAEIAAAGDNRLRHFKVPKSWATRPQKRLSGGDWQTASPATVGDFTAAGYFFARELRSETGVPIGLINSSWGGSRIEAWMSGNSLKMDVEALEEQLRPVLEQEKKTLHAVQQKLAQWPKSGGGFVNNKALWADPDLDDSDWPVATVPALWETKGFDGMDGTAWYRTTFTLTATEAKKGITLGLGPIDDSDQTWVNGIRIGETIQSWNTPRRYPIAGKHLQAGLNTIAIRVEDTGGGGGIHGDPDLNFIQIQGNAPRQLSSAWKFRPDEVTLNIDDNKNQFATLLYNKMIYPLQPYAIKGVIWYQGEANATSQDAYSYRFLFSDMIKSWRNEWQQKNLPFLWVQLANYISGADDEYGSPWAVLRESQSTALSLPKTAEAVIIDIGNPDDIHPRNKQDVGHRLALAARRLIYDEQKLIYSGPRLHNFKIDGNSIRLKFRHTGSGLSIRGDQLHGFTIAGSDKRFIRCNARIDGDTVVVSHPDIAKPVAVRYAWSDNPETANLINTESLPAAPFRTDEWAVLERPAGK